ncbi:hypothetical protein SLA2020_015280 [Shorea laevis]
MRLHPLHLRRACAQIPLLCALAALTLLAAPSTRPCCCHPLHPTLQPTEHETNPTMSLPCLQNDITLQLSWLFCGVNFGLIRSTVKKREKKN